MKTPPPVTDHAVLRYLERVGGIDVERIRDRIWKQARSAAGNGCSSTTVGGVTFKMTNGRVITVISVKLTEPEIPDET